MDFVAVLEIRPDKVALPIIIPKRTAIIPAAAERLHFVERLPRPCRVRRRRHEIALVRRAKIDPEFIVVKTNRSRPDSLAVTIHLRPRHIGPAATQDRT